MHAAAGRLVPPNLERQRELLAVLALRTSLKWLSLNGISVVLGSLQLPLEFGWLSSLQQLRHLHITASPELARGLASAEIAAAVSGLPALQSLTLCTHGAPMPLLSGLTRLTALRLLGDSYHLWPLLARLPCLACLAVDAPWEFPSDRPVVGRERSTLVSLAGLSQLTGLEVRSVASALGEMLHSVLPALPQLLSLVVTAHGWRTAHLPVTTFSSLESLAVDVQALSLEMPSEAFAQSFTSLQGLRQG